MYQSPARVLREQCVIRNEWPLHLTQRQPASVARMRIGRRAESDRMCRSTVQELPSTSEEGVVLLWQHQQLQQSTPTWRSVEILRTCNTDACGYKPRVY